ncbi:hypothetical protein LLE49_01895 [Alicyclobacillus tolerans]|uniref:hypothetical protein n=1 Tax=Alicyclobacillus tolerans TaxID=90970 RepID=UPI001F246689|nr:hypothetical protein [Alicyclobacillus tolerans]MCF8563495.1 hypothetical protein [Alicyclobacillus tolerans]
MVFLLRFPTVKSLRGELKRSEIRGGIRYQLTTKEFILQRPEQTYRIDLEHILGVTECSEEEIKAPPLRSVRSRVSGTGKPYKIVATLLYSITPNRVIEQSRVSFYTRLSPAFARQLSELLMQTG